MNIQAIGDKTAIGLSFLCTVHCIVLPIVLLIAPSIAAFSFNDKQFHQYMLAAVFINSIFALSTGYRKHKQSIIYAWGISGLSLLLLAFVLGHDALGEFGEKAFTLLGAIAVAYGHVKNHRLCCKQACSC
ncbi:MerC domain-containing protein [Aliikangiella coralliicola]|uniref:MerC domain-containing protein n=1 Tax=Aliikangiella coralliicola TaxID=2592383 RepID=A0A545UGF1_9GAMM|nr:MerC domain-containing protein [Aliikangiella coralliicola]TQV88562.1 MerC domain-containing protein [Aliikangiella coralliicola]